MRRGLSGGVTGSARSLVAEATSLRDAGSFKREEVATFPSRRLRYSEGPEFPPRSPTPHADFRSLPGVIVVFISPTSSRYFRIFL